MQTVREQLVEALKWAARELHKMAYSITSDHTLEFEDCHAVTCTEARAAIKRAKREPEDCCHEVAVCRDRVKESVR